MVTTNPILAKARGGLGKTVVFKQMYGKTVMTNYPRKAEIPWEKQSIAQRATRNNFRDAIAYAKQALKDPVQKAYYEKKKKKWRLLSAYQAAITDYMRKLKSKAMNQRNDADKTGGQRVTWQAPTLSSGVIFQLHDIGQQGLLVPMPVDSHGSA